MTKQVFISYAEPRKMTQRNHDRLYGDRMALLELLAGLGVEACGRAGVLPTSDYAFWRPRDNFVDRYDVRHLLNSHGVIVDTSENANQPGLELARAWKLGMKILIMYRIGTEVDQTMFLRFPGEKTVVPYDNLKQDDYARRAISDFVANLPEETPQSIAEAVWNIIR